MSLKKINFQQKIKGNYMLIKILTLIIVILVVSKVVMSMWLGSKCVRNGGTWMSQNGIQKCRISGKEVDPFDL